MNASDFKSLQLLLAVHRAGGFAAAARDLGLTRAAISRSVAQLESRCKVRLARRTTRQVVLTEAAQSLVARCAEPVRTLELALSTLGEIEGALAGRVRLAGSAAFGRDVIVPVAMAFRVRHPAVTVDLTLSDRVEDLVARPLDVAVRLGPLPDSAMVARLVGHLPLVLAASPALVARHGMPRRVSDLTGWPAVGFRVPGTVQRYAWVLREDRRLRRMEPVEPVAESDSIDAVAALVRAGAGIAVVPRHLVERDLRERRLHELLPSRLAPGPEVHVCYAHRSLVPRRVRALIDWLLQELPAHCRVAPRSPTRAKKP